MGLLTIPQIANRALANLYNTIVLAGLVYRDYDPEFSGKQGDTVTVRTPATFVAKEFNRSNGIELQDPNEGSFDVKLDTLLDVSFPLTAEDLTLNLDNVDERLIKPAMEALAQDVDGRLAEAVVEAANEDGGGGVISSSGGDHYGVFRRARARLGRNKLPLSDRYSVLSSESAGEVLGDDKIVETQKSGSTDALREGIIGRLSGFETYESQTLGWGAGERGSADGVAFHKSGVALATRTLEVPKGIADEQAAVVDYKGLGLRVVYDYDINLKQDVCSVDLLLGTKTVRKQACIELDFGQGS